MSDWHCEIRWLGSESDKQSGDCILIRWGTNLSDPDKRTVAVIDAGRSKKDCGRLTTELAEMSVDVIDYLIGTHSDTDHISQFKNLLDDSSVGIGQLWLLNPYDHIDDAYESGDPSVVAASANTVAQTMFHPQVDNGDVEHINPRPGETKSHDGVLQVVGPSKDYYVDLLPDIFTLEQLEAARADAINDISALSVIATQNRKNFKKLEAVRASAALAAEAPSGSGEPVWNEDQLGTGLGDATNNASVIILLTTPGGDQHLFTGDAGVPAFDSAASAMENAGFNKSKLRIFQLPHHGSKGNVSTELLNQLLGEPIDDRTEADAAVDGKQRTCIAMCGKNDPYHASGLVTDAVYRRGWAPYATDSNTIISHRWNPEKKKRDGLPYIGFGENPKDR